MFKKGFLCFLAFLCISFDSQDRLPVQNEKEALFLRRIVDFYEENQMDLVKSEIQSYLKHYPKNLFSEFLSILIADVYLLEKEYDKAIFYYQSVSSLFYEKIALNYLSALYSADKIDLFVKKADEFLSSLQEKKLLEEISLSAGQNIYEWMLNKEDKKYIDKAKSYFQKILSSSYEKEALSYLADICKLDDDFSSAAEFKIAIAEKYPALKEDYLFEAAGLIHAENFEKAYEIYEQLITKRTAKASDAAYNQLVLLFQHGRFQSIAEKKDKYLSCLEREQLVDYHYLMGHAYYYLQKFSSAVDELNKFLKRETEKNEKTLSAFKILLSSANQLNDQKLFEKIFSQFIIYFPEDKNYEEVLFAKALLNKNKKNYQKAILDFAALEKTYIGETEEFLFEKTHLHFLLNENEQTIDLAKNFIQKFPDSLKKSSVYNLLIQSLFYQNLPENRLDLIHSVEYYLKELAKGNERFQYAFLLAQLYYDAENYEKTIDLLKKIEDRYPQKNEMRLLMAAAYQKMNLLNDFCFYAEEIVKDPDYECFDLHIGLFNAYIDLSKEDEKVFSLAAEHLYTALGYEKEIAVENLLWLADFYESSDPKKALNVLEKVFDKETITEEKPFLEQYAFQLYCLYEKEKMEDRGINILQRLVSVYDKIEANWQYSDRVFLKLGHFFRNKKKTQQAIAFFEKIPASSFFYSEACFYKNRLIINEMPDNEQTFENPIFKNAVFELKDLKNKRRIETEPFHIEAGLEYIEIFYRLKGPENALELLEILQKDYQKEDTLLSKEYHFLKNQFEDKTIFYNCYMNLIESRISYLSSFLLNSYTGMKQALNKAEELLNYDHPLFQERFSAYFKKEANPQVKEDVFGK